MYLRELLLFVNISVAQGRFYVDGICCLFILVYLRDGSVLLGLVCLSILLYLRDGSVLMTLGSFFIFILVYLRDGSVLPGLDCLY